VLAASSVGSGVTLSSVGGDMPEKVQDEEQKWEVMIVV
jgi:hypothetical protein